MRSAKQHIYELVDICELAEEIGKLSRNFHKDQKYDYDSFYIS